MERNREIGVVMDRRIRTATYVLPICLSLPLALFLDREGQERERGA